MPTARELAPEELAAYRAAARRREETIRAELVLKKQKAWALARHAAELLRGQFGVKRVVVFGSLVHDGCFTEWSDVDIAAWGIQPEETFRAIGAVMDLDTEIEVNLADVTTCSSSILRSIEQDGIDI